MNAADADWPVELRGVTESIVTTLGPNDRWNVAALGLDASGSATDDGVSTSGDEGPESGDEAVIARTWGRTRTRRNFEERGEGYVQFSRDAVDFVEAALDVREEDDPILASADAWVRVSVDRLGSGTNEGTEWVDWQVHPLESNVDRRSVPTTDRGYAAVVEATVAASRLDVDAYDESVLQSRIDYFEGVARRCGGRREAEAFDVLRKLL